MSSYQSNIVLARSRSLRAPTKPSLTALQSQSITTASANSLGTASHVSLFLTNLRLLDLDLEPDWPGITPATLSGKDAAGGLKTRIHCVEWALYQLFVLWDPEEARNKLKPFYPPLDQVQSINLRAALLRGLEQAKRSGVLGRDTVIRKTMLDECKGNRFEEVLAVFSSAVLKKLVAERSLNSGPEYRQTFSEKIALVNWGYSGERTELNGLLLVHKASLRAGLREKEVARERYRDFEELLALKERTVARRHEQFKETVSQDKSYQVPSKLIGEVRQALRTSWTGSDQWVEALLYGDTASHKDGLLNNPFGDLWAAVRQGRPAESEDKSAGLLEQLDQRLQRQQARLDKWKDFRKKLFGNLPVANDSSKKKQESQKGIDLGFTAHQNLEPGKVRPETVDSFKLPTAPPEYAKILASMKAEIGNIGKSKIPDFRKLADTGSKQPVSMSTSAPTSAPEPVSDLSEVDDEPEETEVTPKPPIPAVARHSRGPGSNASRPQASRKKASVRRDFEPGHSTREDAVAKESGKDDNLEAAMSRRSSNSSTHTTRAKEEALAPEQDTETTPKASSYRDHPVSPDLGPPSQPRSKKEAEPEIDMCPPSRSISPTQAMADQILASMSNASPSPVKKSRHTLSLEERTRLSMSATRISSFDPDDETESQFLSPLAAKNTRSKGTLIDSSVAADGDEDMEDLVARTRRSMAGYEAARQKAQLERRRSQRKSKMEQRKGSHFPKLEEETEVDTSIMDDLLAAGPEHMDAVFMSRSKMRMSPVPSPSRVWDDYDEDIDVGE